MLLLIAIYVVVPLVSSQTVTKTDTITLDPDKIITANVVKGIKGNGNTFTPLKKNIGNVYNVIVKQNKVQLPDKEKNVDVEIENEVMMLDMEQVDYSDPVNLITMEVSQQKYSIVIYSYCLVQGSSYLLGLRISA